MPRRAVIAVIAAALPLAAASPAYALHKDDTVTSGQVTATLSYDYKRSRFGDSDYSNLHVTIDRAGARLVDQALEPCPADDMSCPQSWPAGGSELSSVTLRGLDCDEEPEVLIDLYSGGANCCYLTQSFRFDELQNKYIEKLLRPGLSFPYTLKDLNDDALPEFRSVDYRFAYKYGSNADTPRPLRIFDWDHGRLVDVTIAYPKLAARDAADMYGVYLHFRKNKDVNLRGVLAAYVADSYNAGNGRAAWRKVVAAFRRGELNRRIPFDVGPFGRKYLKSL